MIEEKVKDRIILIVGLLCCIFFIWAIGASSGISKHKRDLESERRRRLELEEQNVNFSKEKSALEENVRQLTGQLEEEKATQQITNKALVQERKISMDLREELEKVIRLKEALEEDLKEALIKEPRKREDGEK